MLLVIWATFVRKFIPKNFQKITQSGHTSYRVGQTTSTIRMLPNWRKIFPAAKFRRRRKSTNFGRNTEQSKSHLPKSHLGMIREESSH